ncbi:hypothetical protein ACELLULO517_20575 [Acidisoma cellulosilytica]|uniref:Uncharacterized protein n=1 Tax=Acidisoma cellulosilyticum TaxID=2802395 RepID=A0A963Z509_9PROT|nr:hypothetical protein [Acidisoma cellulosilyticum]MCB8882651.1 hypothetical protein [Acidisoma cellulosilyticum]
MPPEVVDPPPSSLPIGKRLRELLLALTYGLTSPDSIHLFRAIVGGGRQNAGVETFIAGCGPSTAPGRDHTAFGGKI